GMHRLAYRHYAYAGSQQTPDHPFGFFHKLFLIVFRQLQRLATSKLHQLMLTRHPTTRHVMDTFLPFLRVLTLPTFLAGIRA
ncbi:hypothetical protein ACLHY5_32325, partial [Klebsiella pneumoniae]